MVAEPLSLAQDCDGLVEALTPDKPSPPWSYRVSIVRRGTENRDKLASIEVEVQGEDARDAFIGAIEQLKASLIAEGRAVA